MRKFILILSSVALCAIITFTSCRKGPDENVYQDGQLNIPNTAFDYFDGASFEGDRLATLGRVLFYDKHLSKNNSISCASCHIQEHAFGDNKALSQGFANKRTHRNSMAIHNINNFNSFSLLPRFTSLFWDGRTTDIKEMVLEPSLNHIEMGLSTTEEILEKVKTLSYYKPLLDQASIDDLKIEDISNALAHFVVSINVKDSKFDKVHPVNQKPATASFTALEQHGESVFHGKYNCASCHKVTLSGYSQNQGRFANIGLDKLSKDEGRMEVSGNEFERGAFKIPGLRNVEFSAPYMHDGRFNTLSEVIDHYSHGIQNAPNLGWELQENGQAKKMNITAYDKKALISFLRTLTDYDVLTHERFSNPFTNQ